jgi:hypothetical protein
MRCPYFRSGFLVMMSAKLERYNAFTFCSRGPAEARCCFHSGSLWSLDEMIGSMFIFSNIFLQFLNSHFGSTKDKSHHQLVIYLWFTANLRMVISVMMTKQVQEEGVDDTASFLLANKVEDVEATATPPSSSSSNTSCVEAVAVGGDNNNIKMNSDNRSCASGDNSDDDDDDVDDEDDDDDNSIRTTTDEDSVEETLALLQILSYFCLESFSRLSFYLPVFMQFIWGIAVYILRSLVLTYAVKLFLCQRNKNSNKNNNHNNAKDGKKISSHYPSHHHLSPPLIKDISSHDSSRGSSSNIYNTVTSWLTSALVPIMLLLPQLVTENTATGNTIISINNNNVLLNGIASSSGKAAAAAWPPPALVCLALLTVFALIVHPDGMTWILLRKLRYEHHAYINWSMNSWSVVCCVHKQNKFGSTL